MIIYIIDIYVEMFLSRTTGLSSKIWGRRNLNGFVLSKDTDNSHQYENHRKEHETEPKLDWSVLLFTFNRLPEVDDVFILQLDSFFTL